MKNIRELQNTVEYAVNIVKGDYIGINDLPPKKFSDDNYFYVDGSVSVRPLCEVENYYIKQALSTEIHWKGKKGQQKHGV